jgi:peptidoglycan hydrolase CwlO-like protein
VGAAALAALMNKEHAMILRSLKYAAVGAAAVALVGGFVFGRDLISYIRTGTQSMRHAVKDSVPIEFELQRARDLLEQIIPEMHANIRLIAQEEVELKSLEADVAAGERSIQEERTRLARLRDMLEINTASYQIGQRSYDRDELRTETARRLERLKEAQVILASKHRLLEGRQRSLNAAIETLESTQSRKALLHDKVMALEAQHRLVQTTAQGSGLQLDRGKMAQTEKLIGDIKTRLDVAERVLAREARFVQPLDISPLNEVDLLAEVDAFLGNPPQRTAQAQDSDRGYPLVQR